MEKNTYELTYIINGVLNDNQIKDVVQRVNKYIEEHGGEIIEVDEWGTRRLAYPIRKKRNGYYVNLYFTAPGELVARLERALQISDDVLRYMTLVMDAKMLRYYEQQKTAAQRARAEEKSTAKASSRDDDDDDD